jgi:uncharacterized PurR-regulated membrane protein YhhQ (DUF165 family)
MIRRALLAIAVLGAYVATIAAANWAISRFGAIPVGFGLVAPAGVYFAGLAFTLRDLGQDLAGRVAVVLAILAGSALSWLLADSLQLATASAVAFALSELVDFGIYTRYASADGCSPWSCPTSPAWSSTRRSSSGWPSARSTSWLARSSGKHG